MKAILRLDGRKGQGLLMHNERLSDPLDPFARELKEISSKRSKTDADHLELGRREFLGGLYVDENGPCLPAWNIIRCLQDGARRHKLGKDVLRGVFPLVETATVLYQGPRDPDELWTLHAIFSLRKGVGIGGKKVMRTRPLFKEWAAELPVEVDPTVFDEDALSKIWRDAGIYSGIGDMRPVYGRFDATVITKVKWLKQADGDTDSIWSANAVNVKRIIEEDEDRLALHA